MSYLALGQPYQPNNFIWYELLLQTTQLCKSYKLVFLLTSETDEGAMAMLGRIYRVFFFFVSQQEEYIWFKYLDVAFFSTDGYVYLTTWVLVQRRKSPCRHTSVKLWFSKWSLLYNARQNPEQWNKNWMNVMINNIFLTPLFFLDPLPLLGKA